jgi:predicted helicase
LQLQGFQKILIHDLSKETFADMYAQTVSYGMFAARLNERSIGKEKFTRIKAAELIPQSNPFLRQFFHQIAGFDLDARICWVVDALADIFNCVSVEDILKEFEHSRKDPYIHFYETFLSAYDPKLKEKRGVYYTPFPAVQFIVQAVDDILQRDFGLSLGLADNKVDILEPALGTGTFLSAVIDKIYEKFAAQKGAWSAYCKEHLIPRLNGFEILMAPYAMAHFKLHMKLKETGYECTERLRVFLTNSLEQPATAIEELPFTPWLATEAREAGRIKQNVPVMVVMGNPPYSGESANRGCLEDLMADYKKEPSGDRLHEQNSKWLNDDYVKFIRYGQSLIEKNTDGVLAYINNHGFLDNPTFRGMRWELLRAFDTIYIFDLHGNVKKKESAPDGGKDENVFNIQQGVSINIFIKTGKKKDGELARVQHFDLYGMRELKYQFLLENTLATVKWQEVKPHSPQYFFVSKNLHKQMEYEKGFSINELFPVNSAGIVTARDAFSIQDTKKAIENTIKEFLQLDDETARARFNLGKDVRDWSVAGARRDLLRKQTADSAPPPYFDKNIVKISYRPFDIRWTYYTGRSKGFHCMPRGEVMQHFYKGDNIGLIAAKQCKDDFGVFVTKTIAGHKSCVAYDINTVFPLYLSPEANELDTAEKRRPNLNSEILQKITDCTTLCFTDEKSASAGTFCPIDVFDYIYAILHSPTYREKYREFLKIDFPRVPYPENAGQFFALAALGAKLRKIHLLEGVEPSQEIGMVQVDGSGEVEKVEYKADKVWINKTQYFDAVPPGVWNFYIGGYQPAQKWLKDRKGRVLDYKQLQHYQRILSALRLTGEVMAQIDEVAGEEEH